MTLPRLYDSGTPCDPSKTGTFAAPCCVSRAYFTLRLRFTGEGAARFVGGVASIRRSASSKPIPSPLCSSFGEFSVGLGFDGFPGFVALNLGSVGQALAFDALQDSSGALHVVDAKGDAMIPAEVEFGGVALQMLLAHAVEGADKAAL